MSRPTIAITIGTSNYDRMFGNAAWDALGAFGDVVHHAGEEPATRADLISLLPGAAACVTSWGVAPLDEEVIGAASSLRAMAHMGSSVRRFVSSAVWRAGISVTSAGIALARDVAETTLGLMIVGRKNVWPLGGHVGDGGWRDTPAWDRWRPRELNRATVGIVGASNVGRHVISLLGAFEVEVLLYDPFVDADHAEELGVATVTLEELLSRSNVVSLHAPATTQTRHMLDAASLALMRDDALLINTARGDLIDEAALVAELSAGRFFAFLDVTDPEPPVADSPLRSLPNVVMTPHIAGCIENCNRMGELAVEELRRFFSGEPPVYRITEDMLDRIA